MPQKMRLIQLRRMTLVERLRRMLVRGGEIPSMTSCKRLQAKAWSILR